MKRTIVWNVTSKCNLDCGFCFAARGEREYSAEEARAKIDEFAQGGVRRLVFTGGEPLLREDIVGLVARAKEKGLETVLHTNSLFLSEELVRKFRGILDRINLPLDAWDEESAQKIRGVSAFQTSRRWIDRLGGGDQFEVVVSTVVTKVNLAGVEKIGRLIPEGVIKWRVFQFYKEGKTTAEIRRYQISAESFASLDRRIRQASWPFEVQMVPADDQEFYHSYDLV